MINDLWDGLYEDALRSFQRAIASNKEHKSKLPGLSVAYFYQGLIQATKLEQTATAASSFQLASDLDSSSTALHFNLGDAESQLGHHHVAIVAYSHVIDQHLRPKTSFGERPDTPPLASTTELSRSTRQP